MRYMYVWLTMIGISTGIRRGQFTAIDTVVNMLEKRFKSAKSILFVLTTLMQIAFFILLIFYGWKFSMANMAAQSTALRVSMGLMYLAFPIGGILGIIYSLMTVCDVLNERNGG